MSLMRKLIKTREKSAVNLRHSENHRPCISTDSVQKLSPIIFQGMETLDIHALYTVTNIITLDTNDILFKAGNIADTVYVILKGRLSIVDNNGSERLVVAVIRKGDWITDIDFNGRRLRTCSAIAAEASTVMVIHKNLINSLDDKLRLSLLKKMQSAATERIRQLTAENARTKRKNNVLMQDVFSLRTKTGTGFSDSELIQDIIKKVPRLPASTSALVNQLLDEKTSISQAADMVAKDPSLTGIVLKTINSSFYNFRQKISDVNHAIVLLGFNGVYQMIMAESLRRSLPNLPVFQELYIHSLAISHIAFAISQVSRIGKPSEMATIGLLHDIGQVVIELLKKKNPKLSVLIDFLDCPEMGSVLLRAWNIPEIVWKSIGFQYYPEFSTVSQVPVDVQPHVAILHFSHLCYAALQKKDQDPTQSAPFMEEYARLLDWKALSLNDIIYQQILPTLKKRIDILPKPFASLLRNTDMENHS